MCCGYLNRRWGWHCMESNASKGKSFGKILYIQDGYKVSSLFLVFYVLCPKVACGSTGSWTARAHRLPAPGSVVLPRSHLLRCSRHPLINQFNVFTWEEKYPFLVSWVVCTGLVFFPFWIKWADFYKVLIYRMELEREKRTEVEKRM